MEPIRHDQFVPNIAGPLPPFMVALMDRVMARPQRTAVRGAPTPAPREARRVPATPTTSPRSPDSRPVYSAGPQGLKRRLSYSPPR